jgi:hypothetical protein
MNAEVQSRLRIPAIGLMVAGILGVLGHVVNAIMQLAGTAPAMMQNEQVPAWVGSLGVVTDLLAIGLSAFVIFGALKMQKLQSWNLCLAASIVAMVPCSCTCCIGLPLGIWAIILLAKPEVKQAFGVI